MRIRPFKIDVPDEELDGLRRRLDATRWPEPAFETEWDDGTSSEYLKRLIDHWKSSFDWRTQERRLNRLAHYKAEVEGCEVHFVHERGRGPSPMPLILTHGWPGSFAEFERMIPMLVDPAGHGGDARDSFDVVVPSLPGYGFSQAPSSPGVNAGAIAGMWRQLMNGLGYERFGAQGGDIGAGVSFWLARSHPDALVGLHVNYIPASFRPPSGGAAASAEDAAYQERLADWVRLEGAYSHLQATKPQTLAFSLSDSPVGLAAYMVEKFRSWSDCGGDLDAAFSMEELLTNISIYWLSGTVDASLRLYKENRLAPLTLKPGERIAPPLGMALFPRELPTPPRSWVEQAFDVRQWNSMPHGGHFAALEEPETLVEEIRSFFRPLRR